jgi:hypothetical protein
MHPLARAAQLRLTLINERGSRASFSAPRPLIQEQLAKQQDGADQQTSPSQIDPDTPTAAFKDVRNISNLIAEYSGSNPTAGANTVQDKETANLIRSGLAEFQHSSILLQCQNNLRYAILPQR